jgi:hypothetical protein
VGLAAGLQGSGQLQSKLPLLSDAGSEDLLCGIAGNQSYCGTGERLKDSGVPGSETVRQSITDGVAFVYKLEKLKRHDILHAAGLGTNNASSETPL